MDYMLMPLRRYADFSGRSQRKEYWMFLLGYLIVAVLFFLLLLMARGSGGQAPSGAALGIMGLGGIFLLAIIIPSIAVQVRRFHDQDKSGWFVLLNFIPYIGGLIVLVFMCLEGTRGPNRFGPDPKNVEHVADVFS